MSERRIAVAYSGGRDSSALLHATVREAASLGVRVIALHVHHGLSPNADHWLAHCEAQCKRWSRRGMPVDFAWHRLDRPPAKGDSVEAWAREARYEALRAMALAHGVTVVLLAHHRRDQAETFLLQALRGAGVAGLSGMPIQAQRDGVTWHRPWLHKPREAIDAYVRKHRLKHIEDDSNADPRFARNRLRLDVWPSLQGAFNDAETALAMAADWARDASAALDEISAMDLQNIAAEGALQVAPWMMLSEARRTNALRAWIKARHGTAAPSSLVTRLRAELAEQRSARWPLGTAELRVYRGLLRYRPAVHEAARSDLLEERLSVRETGRFALPGWRGALLVEPADTEGVPIAWLAHLVLRSRTGGERFQAGIGRPPRSLKKQYQDAGIPMWDRAGPLFYSGGQLVFVPGLGHDARVLGLAGQPLVAMRWLAEPPPG